MKAIKVIVIRRKGRPYFEAQWTDPVTGKKRRESTGSDRRRDAERFAATIERELHEGTFSRYRLTWEAFRERYESEAGASLSKGTQDKISSTFNAVEKYVSPKYLRALDAGEISRFAAAMRADKLAEATIASRLRHLKASLRWATRLNLIPRAPHITMPAKANEKAGGRAPTPEEFDRFLEALPKVVRNVKDQPSWRELVLGLWWSGLRINEGCRLHWTDDRYITADLEGRRPMFRINSAASKNRKTQRFPIAPEFHEMLQAVPESERHGFVFNPVLRGRRVKVDRMIRILSAIGEKAGIVVGRDVEEEPVYASAHDLRRAFGTRWAKRVMPNVLKVLMRHASISTTMTFYVDQSEDEAADSMWEAFSRTAPGTESGTIPPQAGSDAESETTVTEGVKE